MSEDMIIRDSVFEDGESPLKESSNLEIDQTMFKWKYPLWYCNNVTVRGGVLFETARSGIWYTNDLVMKDVMIEAPKTFRRGKNIRLDNVQMVNAQETMWNCSDIVMNQVVVRGDYFGMNSQNIQATGVSIHGNYAFDGAKNIEIRDSKLMSKDAFWNCENVTVYDSFITGEYLGWNSKNLTFINCTIESEQGLCYVENLVMKNCKLLNTTLAFEFSSLDVEITTKIDSVKNPLKGKIKAKQIDELIMDPAVIDPDKTCVELTEFKYAV